MEPGERLKEEKKPIRKWPRPKKKLARKLCYTRDEWQGRRKKEGSRAPAKRGKGVPLGDGKKTTPSLLKGSGSQSRGEMDWSQEIQT